MRIALGGMPGPFRGRAFTLGMLPHLCEELQSQAAKQGCPITPRLPRTFPVKAQRPLRQKGALLFLGCTLLWGWKVPSNIPTGILGKPGSCILACALTFLLEIHQKEAAGENVGLRFFFCFCQYTRNISAVINKSDLSIPLLSYKKTVMFHQHLLNSNFHALLNSSTL